MRQALAKATRRELRRALGVSAAATLTEHEQTVQIVARSLSDARRQLDGLDNAVRTNALHFATLEKVEDMDRELRIYVAHGYSLIRRDLPAVNTFWGRLCWLVKGA